MQNIIEILADWNNQGFEIRNVENYQRGKLKDKHVMSDKMIKSCHFEVILIELFNICYLENFIEVAGGWESTSRCAFSDILV